MKIKTSLAAAVATLITAGCSSSGSQDDKIPTDVARDAGISTASPAPKKAEGTVTNGTWKVGAEVKPGTYITTAPDDVIQCYWARLKNFDGDLDSIIANGNIEPGQRGRFTIKKTDKGIELNGDCVWVLDRNPG